MQAVTHLQPAGPVTPQTNHHKYKTLDCLLPLTTMRVLALLALVGTAAAFVPSQPSPFGATT